MSSRLTGFKKQRADRQPRREVSSKLSRLARQNRNLAEIEADNELLPENEEERRERILRERMRRKAILQPKKSEVNRVNFEHFKNRYSEDQPIYAIDVLVGGQNLQPLIRRELALRRKEKIARLRRAQLQQWANPNTSESIQPMRSNDETQDKYKKTEKPNALKPDTNISTNYIHRVRIQSQPVLAYLTYFLGVSDKKRWPRTFLKPFRTLVYFQPQMKKALENLEKNLGGLEESSSPLQPSGTLPETKASSNINSNEPLPAEQEHVDDAKDDFDDDNSDLETDMESIFTDDDNPEEIMETAEALRDMRCYVDFVEREIMPLYDQFKDNSAQKVTFKDLWALFRVGDEVYLPPSEETSQRYHQLWRIYRVQSPKARPQESSPHLDFVLQIFDEPETPDDKEIFILYCYYIDYDGSSYGAVRHKFYIKSFSDERDIQSLEVYPLRFYSGREALLESLTQQGQDFNRFLKDKYQSYNGWTLTRNPPMDREDPHSEILEDEQGDKMLHPEFVESHVIVDLEEAYQSNSNWRPQFHRPRTSKTQDFDAENDNIPIQHWTSRSRQQLLFSVDETTQIDEGIEMRQRNDNIEKDDMFLQNRTKQSRSRSDVQKGPNSLVSKDLVLLPKRMFAYVLRQRRFVPVDMQYLKPVIHDQNVFADLEIEPKYKKSLRGLVNSHFDRRGLERGLIRNHSTEGIGQDLIQGKGKGLVILLHGVPGVGKTATAEAVAVETQKPLFVITCGDLGLTPEEVERRLSNVFRLAHLWDCVLLLDEADVFLAQRSKLDMQRNALVSVFLRVLEYYHGLLFLTTNRVGIIDEAFKSRVHVSLYYSMLSQSQTEAIFKVNLKKLRMMDDQRIASSGQTPMEIDEDKILQFSKDHYQQYAPKGANWNGRQIRNAFQIAAGIAYYNYAEKVRVAKKKQCAEPYSPVLDRTAFDEVQDVTLDFEEYMRETKGWTDAELAHLMAERANDHAGFQYQGGPRTFRNGNLPNPPMNSSFSRMPQNQQSMGYSGDHYHDTRQGPTYQDPGYDPSPMSRSQLSQSSLPHHSGRYDMPSNIDPAHSNPAHSSPLGSKMRQPETPRRHVVQSEGGYEYSDNDGRHAVNRTPDRGGARDENLRTR